MTSFIDCALDVRLKPDIDDNGNEETLAVCDSIIEGKSSKEAFASVSKLRQKNALLLGEVDPRYRGKKASRKSISNEEEESFDPELAKYCIIEDDDSDQKDDDDDDQKDNDYDDQKDDDDDDDQKDDSDDDSQTSEVEKKDIENNNMSDYNEKSFDTKSLEYDYMKMAEDNEEEDGEEDETEEENDNSEVDDDDDMENDSVDYESSDNIEDVENMLNNELRGNLNLEGADSVEQPSTRIQTFSKEEVGDGEMSKGVSVKNQCLIYDKLLEARIGLQKVATISNQLPQFDKYKSFLDASHYPLYKENLLAARKEIKMLLSEVVKLQKLISQNNQETAAVIESEESDSEEDCEENNKKEKQKGKKRKLEKFEEILRKRHKNMISFRDEALNKWQEKSKLLTNHSKKSNFGKFEISPSIQIKNILANKEELVKKTRFIGVSRGNAYKIVGKGDTNEETCNLEEHDPEIFDDSDFHSRMVEDFLKSKISFCSNLTEVSMHWVAIQKLRKKAKKKVEANASKGKKIRHQTITKQQNFMAPCKYSVMSDEATNKLFSSLFGGSVK